MTWATVLGASFGYVSNSNVPFDVSTTTTGPSGWAVGTISSNHENTKAPKEHEQYKLFLVILGAFRVFVVSVTASQPASLRCAGSTRESRRHRSAGRPAGRRSGPTSPDTG